MCNKDTRETTVYTESDKPGFHSFDKEILKNLLKDMTTGKPIIWATDDYSVYNPEFTFKAHITPEAILSMDGDLVRPRVKKSNDEQQTRIHDKAEVFTPAWICNEQNNLIDEEWFGYKNVFNTQTEYTWNHRTEKIVFPNTEGRDWMSYVKDIRLEITCGEAPYLVSRYDVVSGSSISIERRIGMLDRKLRVVNENTQPKDKQEWFTWVKNAYKSVYGYEWQGDNLLLARENLLYTFVEYYEDRFKDKPTVGMIGEIVDIIVWNLWQMDGLKCVIPNSCIPEVIYVQQNFLDDIAAKSTKKAPKPDCLGCKTGQINYHKGIYCTIMDWDTGKPVQFLDVMLKR